MCGERSRNAYQDRVSFSETIEIRGRLEPLASHDLGHHLRWNMFNCAFATIHLRNARFVDVETDNRKSSLGCSDGKWKSNIAEADDTDLRAPFLESCQQIANVETSRLASRRFINQHVILPIDIAQCWVPSRANVADRGLSTV